MNLFGWILIAPLLKNTRKLSSSFLFLYKMSELSMNINIPLPTTYVIKFIFYEIQMSVTPWNTCLIIINYASWHYPMHLRI